MRDHAFMTPSYILTYQLKLKLHTRTMAAKLGVPLETYMAWLQCKQPIPSSLRAQLHRVARQERKANKELTT